MNVISGRLCMYLSITPIVLESIIEAICCIRASICSVYMSADMNATFTYEMDAKTKAESKAVTIPILNVS